MLSNAMDHLKYSEIYSKGSAYEAIIKDACSCNNIHLLLSMMVITMNFKLGYQLNLLSLVNLFQTM